MARSGDAIENPTTGERIEFRKTASETDGRTLEFDYYLEPGGFVVAEHAHPNQEELLEVVEGSLNVSIDGDEWVATAGTKFAVPAGVDHRVWNESDEPVRVLTRVEPALDLERFFETLFGLAREGKTSARGLPGPLQGAVLARAFREEIRVSKLPEPLQGAAVSALAPIGRLLGYRASYPRYRTE